MAKTKTKTTPAPTPAPEERGDNRWVRVTKVIIDEGESIDAEELALKAELDLKTAKRIKSVLIAVFAALREAKLMPAKATPKKAPTAPSPEPAEAEPAPAK